MTKPVRYQEGCLYEDHGAWFVRYRERVRLVDGTIKLKQRSKRLGSLTEYPRRSDIKPLQAEFMRQRNATQFNPDAGMTLDQFVRRIYLPHVEARREPSTYKGYREIIENHILTRVGDIRLGEFRTVDASRMLEGIAAEHDLSKTTLQHIKSVLSGVFAVAKNKGAYDGVNPVQDALTPDGARGPKETHAYDLATILRILETLPVMPKAVVATASLAGLREGELKGMEWQDYRDGRLHVERSVWRSSVKKPKTHSSRKPVPVIPRLAKILDVYRNAMGDPSSGVMFHNGAGERMDLDKLAQRVIRPRVEALGVPWYGWHGFRRGIASNLFALGADDKVVQRILRHAKPHVTRERYIKAFEPAVLAAMDSLQQALDELDARSARVQQLQ